MSAVRADYRRAPIDEKTRGLLVYAEKLTRTPSRASRQDLDRLRALGWDDRALLDATQVAAYFNYINRVALGLGIDPEPEWMDEAHRV